MTKSCATCGRSFGTWYSWQIYCSDECYAEMKRRQYVPTKVGREAACFHCSGTFIMRSANNLYCSDDCRAIFYREHRGSRYFATHPEEYAEVSSSMVALKEAFNAQRS